ncbi:sensor histidine kinase [Polaribacter sp. Hel1_85]|uniref:ATP-binding protein n=1 Tax=Polaribacter sp. Hel1_85 TaxID=1250005 RepID=UPI00052B9455|nr:sensor histidine kinase [Polaribacter sp. Hel1_85]KGL58944.1 signal transduction histidine kinase [Polaribacter sp. Hel1_85]
MQKNQLQFKISSALKNIIGRDLITDDFIAVFELVKNSYDAHATRVDVIFKDIYTEKGKIIIKDNGKGMGYQDLLDKWLFVARSSKKEGDEEDSYKNFRDKIKVKRAYAGAKGIGRFSCDRLGSGLYLETIKDEKDAKVEALVTDWNKFAEDSNNEFVNVSVLHETLEESSYGINKGTVLEISNLNNNWEREKFENLKDSLARLINPSAIKDDDSFKIFLSVEDEAKNDEKQKEKNKKKFDKGDLEKSEINYFKIINGEIKNPIFETLQLKTSYIESDISSSSIITTLYEGGELVYKIEEDNPFPNFKDIHYSIFFMNQSAKSTFSRRMGVQPVEYGHIFVYKNGLRIYPYGERGDDPFKMDVRKGQGYARNLGTREVLGYISINGENNNLKETSSRGDGFIKTSSYFHLEKHFYETLKKLEKYTIDITDWGNFLSDDDYININESFVKNEGKPGERIFNVNENLSQLISSITRSKSVKKFEVSKNILDILDSKSEKSAQGTLKKLSEKIDSDSFDKDEVKKTIKNVEKKLSDLKSRKEEAEEEALQKYIENEELKTELDREIAEKLFDKTQIGREKKDLLALQHQIIHTAGNITWSLDSLIDAINDEKPKNELIDDIKDISLEVQRIVSASRFVTKAGFNTQAEKITKDIVSFINDYINNIYIPADSFIHKKRPIKISITKPNFKKEMKFRPFEITVVLDNLFSNSRKATATEVSLEWKKDKTHLLLFFKDNGYGIPDEVMDSIFEFRYSNTDGSGIGLYHVRDILEKYKSKIECLPNSNGAEFLIKIPL